MSALRILRRTLLDGEVVRVGEVRARAPAWYRGEVQEQPANLLVMPLAGVFTKHESAHRQAIGTPEQAVLITSHSPYRISYPGGLGDRCLTLAFSDETMERICPAAARGPGRAPLAPATRTRPATEHPARMPSTRGAVTRGPSTQLPLGPASMLRRSLLWRGLHGPASDPLAAEELALDLLSLILDVDDTASARHQVPGPRANAARQGALRSAERVRVAVSRAPDHRWTLAELAREASVSPHHLSHQLREHLGLPAHRFVLHARLAMALERVLEDDAELTAVALEHGFCSQSHFTAHFRALFGITPGALRGQARGACLHELRKILTARLATER